MNSIKNAWRKEKGANSLPEVFSSVSVPLNKGFWKTLFAFTGPDGSGGVHGIAIQANVHYYKK